MPKTQTMEELAEEQRRSNTVIDDKIRKSVARYVELEKRAKALNEEKKNEREQMEKLGVHPRAYQDEVRNFKLYDEAERNAYMASRRRMQEVLAPVEKDLFSEEIDARNKRAAKKSAKEGNQPRSEEELNQQTDNSERSDPNAGGAKPQTIAEAAAASQAAVEESIKAHEKPTLKVVSTGDEADLKSNVPTPPNPPGEQEEGEAALNAGLAGTKSQSQIAREKLEAAGLANAGTTGKPN